MAACAQFRAQALFLSQNASCVVLSAEACRASMWTENEHTKFCSLHSSSHRAAPPDRKDIQNAGQRVTVQHERPAEGSLLSEELVTFLLAARKATRGFLYICLPISWPFPSPDTDRGEKGRKRAGTTTAAFSRQAGPCPAAETPSWLCCCVFRLIHRIYGLLSSVESRPEVFAVPVPEKGGWRENFLNAVCTHLRAFPTVRTPQLPLDYLLAAKEVATESATATKNTEEHGAMLVNFVDPHFALTDASFAHSVGDEQSVQGICLDPAVQAILASDGVQLGSLRAECVFSKPTVASSLDQVTVTPAVCGCAAATTPPDQVSLQSFPRDALASASGNSVVAANALRSSLLNRTPFRHEPRSSSENVGSPDTTETARRSRASLDSSGVPPCLVCQYGCSNDPESRDATDAFADKIRVSIPASQVAPAAPPAEQPPFLPAGDASLPASQDSVVPLCRVVNKDGFLNHVVVAGAFDRLHAGHKILLMAAALLARQRVGLAVTSGSLISRKVTDAYLAMASGIEPFCLRSRSAAAFLALLLQASGRSCVFLNYTAQVLCEELGFSEGVLGKDSSEDGEQIERLWRDAYAQATQAWSCFSRAPCGDQAAAANCRLAESCFAAVWSDAVDFPALSACRGKDERGERNRDPGEHPVAICLYRIGDPLGPAGDLDFDALVVSAESVSGGQFVNAERAKRNHRPVLLVEIPTLPPANPGGIWKRDACSALETGGASREAPSHHRSTSHQKTETSQGGARSCTADVSVPAPEPAALARAQASTKLSSTTLRGVQALRLGVSREDLKLLFAAFHAAVSMLIGTPEAVQSAHWTVLCEMYSAPWRRFSTFGRLARLLRIVEETSGGSHAEESQGGRLTPQQQATVSLALLFAFAPAFPGAALRRQKVTVSALETPAGVGVQQAPGENASPIQAQHSLNCAGEPSNEAAFAHALLAGCFVDAASAECTRCAAMHFDLSSEALRLGPASEENNKTVRSMKFDTFSSVSACMNAARSACPFLLASPSGAQTDAMWNQGPVSKAGFPCSRSIQLAVLLDAAVPWPEYLNARAQPFMEENSFLSVHDYRRWRGNQIRVWLSQYCPEGDTRRLAALGLTQEEVERIVFNLKNELKMLSVCDPERVRRAYTPPD